MLDNLVVCFGKDKDGREQYTSADQAEIKEMQWKGRTWEICELIVWFYIPAGKSYPTLLLNFPIESPSE
jgi:hypothetical protein